MSKLIRIQFSLQVIPVGDPIQALPVDDFSKDSESGLDRVFNIFGGSKPAKPSIPFLNRFKNRVAIFYQFCVYGSLFVILFPLRVFFSWELCGEYMLCSSETLWQLVRLFLDPFFSLSLSLSLSEIWLNRNYLIKCKERKIQSWKNERQTPSALKQYWNPDQPLISLDIFPLIWTPVTSLHEIVRVIFSNLPNICIHPSFCF